MRGVGGKGLPRSMSSPQTDSGPSVDVPDAEQNLRSCSERVSISSRWPWARLEAPGAVNHQPDRLGSNRARVFP